MWLNTKSKDITSSAFYIYLGGVLQLIRISLSVESFLEYLAQKLAILNAELQTKRPSADENQSLAVLRIHQPEAFSGFAEEEKSKRTPVWSQPSP